MNDLNDVKTKENGGGTSDKSVILYTIHCPKCKVLEKKLTSENIKFEINENIEDMMNKGFKTAPILEVDGEFYDFSQAIKWINVNRG